MASRAFRQDRFPKRDYPGSPFAGASFSDGHFSGSLSLSPKIIAFACLYTCFFLYITFHTFNGDRGLYALLKEKRKYEVLSGELVKVRTQRENLEHDVRLLRNESLDLDMLDEQVRSNLGMAGTDEVMVLQPR